MKQRQEIVQKSMPVGIMILHDQSNGWAARLLTSPFDRQLNALQDVIGEGGQVAR